MEGDNPPIGQMAAPGAATEVNSERWQTLWCPRVPDGACLQLGIGGMPNAIGGLIAQSDLKDLGVHTEMYVDAFVDIARAGKINGSRKQLDKGRQVYAFGAGTQKLYDYLNDNPECMSASVEYTNDIRTIAALDNFISINNAVDVDLFGQVNAESAGVKHISGAGGQLDFVLGAYLSHGGKSFICLSSTFMNKKTGKLESRIRPTLVNGSIVTDTRANVHYLCTEYGCVNLKGLSTWQKAEALISVAHPDFPGGADRSGRAAAHLAQKQQTLKAPADAPGWRARRSHDRQKATHQTLSVWDAGWVWSHQPEHCLLLPDLPFPRFWGCDLGADCILMPFIYGAVIAYLLKPVCNTVENFLRRSFPEKAHKAVEPVAILLTMLFGVLLVYALLMMIIPQLITSVTTLYYTAQRNINRFVA